MRSPTAIYRIAAGVDGVVYSASEASLCRRLARRVRIDGDARARQLLHDPVFAWAAIGAFWTYLADAAGSSRARFASMMGFALLSTVCGGLTALRRRAAPVVAALAVLVFTSLGAFGRIWGAATSQVTNSRRDRLRRDGRPADARRPRRARVSRRLSIGCLFAVALSLTVWRIQPFGASRASLRTVYLRLADIAFDSARLLNSAARRANGRRMRRSFAPMRARRSSARARRWRACRRREPPRARPYDALLGADGRRGVVRVPDRRLRRVRKNARR